MSPTDTQTPRDAAATPDAAASSDAASAPSARSASKKPGLRERKREELRRRIERAALELMLEHGFDDVTVEMICESADVSRRTFFNYFGSKEAVVVGRDPGPLPEHVQEAFVDGPRGSILADLVRMLLAVMTTKPHGVDQKVWRARLELIRSDRTLAKAMADKVAAKNRDLEDLVARRIRKRYGASGTPPGPGGTAADGRPGLDGADAPASNPAVEALITRQTGFIVAMWWGIARYAIQISVENPDIEDRELMESLLDTLTLIQEAEL
ncbi:TetR family transcriptional regulator [Brachybacterium sp. ACRRE]|uniref:TetR family transcriptional regulator n=1 Tax=Brachybacterium sp. ACRRE TaxID=2918184 RepID=UPI001EF32D18|nr:TetR family transcriptional regulator [Brachybacterium sp. ACRRE]MCG7311128.1 TetR/AcrR family transcriptional regulator [Brachybacterium sp. ACRRE]